METWNEASKANEEVAKFANEELSSLGALKMIHTVRLLLFFAVITHSPISVTPKHLI